MKYRVISINSDDLGVYPTPSLLIRNLTPEEKEKLSNELFYTLEQIINGFYEKLHYKFVCFSEYNGNKYFSNINLIFDTEEDKTLKI